MGAEKMNKMDIKQSKESIELDHIYNMGYKYGQHDLFIPMLVYGILCGAGGYIVALAMM